MDKGKNNDNSVNKADEKKGKASAGEINKDRIIETLDKSEKKHNSVKTAAEQGSISEIEMNQESYKSEYKESTKERKSITVEKYKQRVKTIDSLHKKIIIISIVVMFYQASCLT